MLWTMHRSRLRQISALILALFVALGMSASVVQASNMAIKMAAASGMNAGDHGICDGCGDSAGMKATACGMAVCAAPVLAALPQTLSMMRPDARELPLPTERLLFGSTPSPDPPPPRSSDLG